MTAIVFIIPFHMNHKFCNLTAIMDFRSVRSPGGTLVPVLFESRPNFLMLFDVPVDRVVQLSHVYWAVTYTQSRVVVGRKENFVLNCLENLKNFETSFFLSWFFSWNEWYSWFFMCSTSPKQPYLMIDKFCSPTPLSFSFMRGHRCILEYDFVGNISLSYLSEERCQTFLISGQGELFNTLEGNLQHHHSDIFMYERLLPMALIAMQRLDHLLYNWGKIYKYLKAIVLYLEDWLICALETLLWVFAFWKIKLALHYPVFPVCFLTLWQTLAYSIKIHR